MAREQITAVGDSAALMISDDALQALGLSIGDEVEVTVTDGRLILRSLSDAEREEKLRDITDKLFQRRESAYQRLAEGAGAEGVR